jgi:hypothetical protein
MTTPPPPGSSPSPLPGNPYAQPTGGQNPYADQVPPQGNPYQSAPQQPYAAAPPAPQQPYPATPPPPQPYGQQFQAPPQAPQQPYGQQQSAPQQPYGQPPADQSPYGQQPQPAFAPEPGTLTCRFCGGYPAVDTTVRGHRGMIVVMQWRSMRGPFCRTCGTAAVRDMSAKTLWQGWWGYGSSIITPITLIRNLFAHNKIKALPAPAPGQPGPQMDPGKPLLQRPAAIMFLVPVAVLVVIIAAVVAGSSDATYASVGDCVVNKGTDANPDVHVATCGPGTYLVDQKLSGTTSDTNCPQSDPASYTQQEGSDEFVLCLKPYGGS